MNHKFLRTYFSVPLLVLTVTFLSFSSYADENAINSDESAKQEVEEILVTANRTEQSISDVAQAVQALSGDDLQDLQITDFEQMINLIPGAVQNSTISQGSNVYSMRGVA
ncbi:MAG: TonB-dependent receptor plug domain-containing protein, partial [Alphaproteobacteria bacterium]